VTRVVAELPPNAPRSRGNAFTRWIGRTVLRLGGWKMQGAWPDLPRLMIIVAPHSSAWDAVWGLAAKVAMAVDITFMAKAELFRGPLGWLLRMFGAIAVDRSAPGGVVEAAIAKLRSAENVWFLLAPEGTRKPVKKWKAGFWKIAHGAGVPVFCIGFDYPTRTIQLGQLAELGDDCEADLVRIRQLFAPYRGKNRGAL
jgi:1-acyl-sn-glycerol-3-phosphate acyltransferase